MIRQTKTADAVSNQLHPKTQPTGMLSASQRRALSDKISQDVSVYLKSGGAITYVEPGASGHDPVKPLKRSYKLGGNYAR